MGSRQLVLMEGFAEGVSSGPRNFRAKGGGELRVLRPATAGPLRPVSGGDSLREWAKKRAATATRRGQRARLLAAY